MGHCKVCGWKMFVYGEFSAERNGKSVTYAKWKCKKCGNLDAKKLNWNQRKYRENKEHRELWKTKRRIRELENKIIVFKKYSGEVPKCACCGESNMKFLTIDHMIGKGIDQRKEGIYGVTLITWLIKNDFPPGFQVLCFNCNCGKNVNHGVCPHKD